MDPVGYAAISSNPAISSKPPKSNVMDTERPDSITAGTEGGSLGWELQVQMIMRSNFSVDVVHEVRRKHMCDRSSD